MVADNERAAEAGGRPRKNRFRALVLAWPNTYYPEVTGLFRVSLDGNQLFDKTIQEKIEASALFVALTSAGYMAAWRPLLSNERGARLFCGSSSNPEKTSLNSGSHTSETTVRNSI